MAVVKQFDGFEAAVSEHLDLFYGLSLRLTRNAADAQDLLQDALMKAWRFRDRFEQGTYFKAWMITIIRNTFINDYRKRARRPKPVSWDGKEFTPAQRPDQGLGFVPETLKTQSVFECLDDDVNAAVQALPKAQRETVILADLHDLSYQEIAEELNCPLGTVMSRLHRGRRLLREALQDRFSSTSMSTGSRVR